MTEWERMLHIQSQKWKPPRKDLCRRLLKILHVLAKEYQNQSRGTKIRMQILLTEKVYPGPFMVSMNATYRIESQMYVLY